MSSTLKYFILCVLLILVNNVNYEIVVLPQEVNDGQTKYFEIWNSEIWIYTKINKTSQIIVEITTEEGNEITKDQVQYTKYYKDSNTTAFASVPVLTSLSKNNYKCTYDIDKDDNDYGLLRIKGRKFRERLAFKVTVVGKTTFWIIIVVIIVVVILIIVAVIIVLKKFFRCCK